jgi:hypothetical protein
MATAVYALCALTSLVCALLLARGFVASRVRLLLWCAVCFAGLALNNVVLFIDKVVAPDADLSVWRGLPAALGVMALVYGLVTAEDNP